jgi:formiminotetrahydrofolate cyclodeaminase
VTDLESWLHRLANDPLPGGVAAAALGAAMGAALVSKVLQVTFARREMDAALRAEMEFVLVLAQDQQAELMRCVDADELAYRALLATRKRPGQDLALGAAWRAATEVPIEIAERCRLLLDRLPALSELVWPPVRVDLEIAESLLRAGAHAGLAAAESNLTAWGDEDEARPLWSRIEVLREAET